MERLAYDKCMNKMIRFVLLPPSLGGFISLCGVTSPLVGGAANLVLEQQLRKLEEELRLGKNKAVGRDAPAVPQLAVGRYVLRAAWTSCRTASFGTSTPRRR
jgi:hypothetical protein